MSASNDRVDWNSGTFTIKVCRALRMPRWRPVWQVFEARLVRMSLDSLLMMRLLPTLLETCLSMLPTENATPFSPDVSHLLDYHNTLYSSACHECWLCVSMYTQHELASEMPH